MVAMEKLFEDLFVPARYQVHLATHFLKRDTDTWWRRVQPEGPLETQLLAWAEFRSLMFGAFFPNSVKHKLEEGLRNQ